MRVISYRAIREYSLLNHAAHIALHEWYSKAEQAQWENFAQIKQTFGAADSVGNNRYVFNIGGNKYRLVAIVLFKIQTVYVRFIGTHSDYNKIDCKNI